MKSDRAVLVVFLVLWLVLMIGQRSSLLQDPGTFMHVRTGQVILTDREFPIIDRYSVTAFGEVWIAQQWLGEIVMAILDRIGGIDALVLAAATGLALLYTWLFMRLRRGGMHPLLGVFFLVLVLSGSTHHFLVRPHLFSLVGMGLTCAALMDVESKRKPLKSLFWLVPLYILWSNVHGAVLGGLASIGFVFLGWVLNLVLGGPTPLREEPRMRILEMGLVTVLLGLAPLVNPYGFRLPQTWLGIMDSPAVGSFMIEHAPLLTFWYGWLTLGFGIVYLLFVAGWGSGGFSPSRSLPLVWLVLAYSRVRHAPLFAMAAGLGLADGFAHTGWVTWLAAKGAGLFQVLPSNDEERMGGTSRSLAILALLFMIVGLTCQWAGVSIPLFGKNWARLDDRHWPVELVPRIQSWAAGKPYGEPVFNDLLFGGFLIGNVPKVRVFIDDRCELYQDKRLSDFVKASQDPTPLERWENGFRFTGALVTPGTPLDRWFRTRQGWRLIGETPAAVWYEKQ